MLLPAATGDPDNGRFIHPMTFKTDGIEQKLLFLVHSGVCGFGRSLV